MYKATNAINAIDALFKEVKIFCEKDPLSNDHIAARRTGFIDRDLQRPNACNCDSQSKQSGMRPQLVQEELPPVLSSWLPRLPSTATSQKRSLGDLMNPGTIHFTHYVEHSTRA